MFLEFKDEKNNCYALEAELWAAFGGLDLAMQEGINSIEIESNSQGVVEIINKGPHERVPFRNLIREWWHKMQNYNVRINFTPIKANRYADFRAKIGTN